MAMTPAERKRKQRQLEKERAKQEAQQGGDAGSDAYRLPFSEWAERGSLDDLSQYAALAGFELPAFDNERDPEEFIIDRFAFGDESPLGDAKGALGRAEATVGLLIDMALLLAESVNKYKQNEITERLTELESSNEADRATAMKEAVRLNKMLDQLNRRVRRDFPQWKVTGV